MNDRTLGGLFLVVIFAVVGLGLMLQQRVAPPQNCPCPNCPRPTVDEDRERDRRPTPRPLRMNERCVIVKNETSAVVDETFAGASRIREIGPEFVRVQDERGVMRYVARALVRPLPEITPAGSLPAGSPPAGQAVGSEK